MSLLKLCNSDPVLDLIRELFDATPLKVPEEKIKPLCLVASNGKRSFFQGAVQDAFKTDPFEDLKPQSGVLASVSGRDTTSVAASLGIGILSGFLQGFGLDGAGVAKVSAAMKRCREMSFRFNGVKRMFVEPIHVGRRVHGIKLDKRNPATTMYFRTVDRYDFLVIDSIITSNDFSITVDSSTDTHGTVNLPLLEQAIAHANTDLKISASSERSVTFKSRRSLTFAFSCIRFQLSDDGAIVSLDPQPDVAGLRALPSFDQSDVVNRHSLAPSPGLLVWD